MNWTRIWLIRSRHRRNHRYSHRHPNPLLLIGHRLCRRRWLRSWNQAVRGSQKSLVVLACLKAKTSYCCCRIKLIVKRLKAKRKEFDIGIKAELNTEQKELNIGIEAELDAKQREVESSIKVTRKLDIAVKVTSIEVAAKVGRICLYSKLAEKVRQADLYVSNLLAFLEDSEVKAVAEYIKVTSTKSKLKVKDFLSYSQNSEVLNS
jgi:hypothetical protein